jgi:putative ABC transport system substrate-binding protein
MRRRKFITLLGSAAAVWPFVARAEQRDRTRLVGVLMGFAESDPIAQSMVAAFLNALPKLGWTEGDNVRLELRWGGYDVDRIATLAKELVDLKPDAILGQTTPVISALARVTRTVPVVFVTVSDPIGSGFAANLAHPGGNITGFSVDDYALGGNGAAAERDCAKHQAHSPSVQPGRPAAPIFHAFDSSRRIIPKRPSRR